MAGEPRLTVLGVVGDALRDVFGNLPGLVAIAWPYYAVAAALTLAGGLALGGPDAGPGGWLLSALGSGTGGIVISLGAVACAVRWQRHVVAGEPLRGIAPLDGRVLRYVTWSLLLGLVAAAPFAAAFALGYATGLIRDQGGAGGTPFALGPAGIALLAAGGLLGALLFVRLGLVLPAVSADDPARPRWRASWEATRGHGARLLGVFVLLGLGMALVGAAGGLIESVFATAAADGGERGAGALAASLLFNALVDLVAATVGASAAAQVYRRLRPAAAAGNPPPP